LEDALKELDNRAQNIGLIKKKSICENKKEDSLLVYQIAIEWYMFERVPGFHHLGSIVNEVDSILE
jgi:hypothetical protein